MNTSGLRLSAPSWTSEIRKLPACAGAVGSGPLSSLPKQREPWAVSGVSASRSASWTGSLLSNEDSFSQTPPVLPGPRSRCAQRSCPLGTSGLLWRCSGGGLASSISQWALSDQSDQVPHPSPAELLPAGCWHGRPGPRLPSVGLESRTSAVPSHADPQVRTAHQCWSLGWGSGSVAISSSLNI